MKTNIRNTLAAMLLFAASIQAHASDSVTKATADAAGLTAVSPSDLPSSGGTYWVTMLNPNGGLTALPWPFLPSNLTDPTIYSVTNSIYLVDTTAGKLSTSDSTMSASDAATTANAQAQSMASLIEDIENPPTPPGGETNADGTPAGIALNLPNINDSTNFWLEISNAIISYGGGSDAAYFYLHNTSNSMNYCVWSKTNLLDLFWQPVCLQAGPFEATGGTEQYQDYYDNAFLFQLPSPQQFFWANGSPWVVRIYPDQSTQNISYPSSTNDTSQNITYTLYWFGPTPTAGTHITFYDIGSAVFGQDFTVPGWTYNSTNRIMTYTVPAGASNPEHFTVEPLYQSGPSYAKTLAIQLTPYGEVPFETSYYADINISPQVIPQVVITNTPYSYMDSIGYNPVQNSIVVSANELSNGDPFNFFSITTNETGEDILNTNYSTVSGLPGEVELTIAQGTTNGWNAGDMYFADGSYYSSVDKLSEDGTWSQFWCPLTNSTIVDGIAFDETGNFSNNIVCVTANDNVFTITSNGVPNLLATISQAQTLNGAIVVPNDTTNWGPWAGKILTADPNLQVLYTVDTNGTITSYGTTNYINGISVEEFAIVPPNQNMYFLDAGAGNVDEIQSTNLTPYVGWMAISSGTTSSSYPEGNNYYPLADIFLVHWDSTNSVFDVRGIPGVYSSSYEDLTFGPIDLSK